MYKRLLLLSCLFLLPALLKGVTLAGVYNNYAVGSNGMPVGNATIRVCTWSATPSVPCTPTVNIYSDFTLSTLIDQTAPFKADAIGNFTFYAAPGRYNVQISGPRVYTYTITIVIPVDPSQGSVPFISGVITPGDCAQWVTASTIGDAGAACGSGGGGGGISGATAGNLLVATAATTATSSPMVIVADQFTGANGGAKIVAALATCPATGGVVDARGLLGAQAITASITVPPYCQLLLGAAQYTSTVMPIFKMKDSSQLIGMSQSYQLTGGTVLNVPVGVTGGAIQPFDTTNGNYRVVLRNIRLGHGNPITADGSIGVSLNPAYEWVLDTVDMHGFDIGVLLGTQAAGAFYNTLTHVHIQNGYTAGFSFSNNATQNSCYDCSYQGRSINNGTGFLFNPNAFGNALYTPDVETTSAGTGIALSGRSNAVYSPYLEGLLVGISLDANTSFNTVINGIVTSVGTAVLDNSPLYGYNVVIVPGAQGTASPTNSPVVYPKFWSAAQYAIQGSYPRGNIINELGATGLAAIGVPTAFARTSNVVTATLNGGGFAFTPRVGQKVVIAGANAGVGATSFNGNFTIASASSATSFTFNQTAADDTSTGAGTATVFDALAVDRVLFGNGVSGVATIQSGLDNNTPIFTLPSGATGGSLLVLSGPTINNVPKVSSITGQMIAGDITDLSTGTTIFNNSAGTGTLSVQNNATAGSSSISFFKSDGTYEATFGYFSPTFATTSLQDSMGFETSNKVMKFSHNLGTNIDLTIDTSGNVVVSTKLLPLTAASANIGTALLPMGDIFLGAAANKSLDFNVAGLTTNRTVVVPDIAGTIALITGPAPANNECTKFVVAGAVMSIQTAGAACGSGGGGAAFQVNGTPLISATTVNFTNSAATTGLTLTETNPSAGVVQLGLTGILTAPGGGTGLASGTSGGVLCYTGSTTLASSSALTANILVKGGGAGVCPTLSGITDNATTITTTEKVDLSGSPTLDGLKVPVSAAAAPTANGTLALDTTSGTLVYGSAGATELVAALNRAQTFTAVQTFGTINVNLINITPVGPLAFGGLEGTCIAPIAGQDIFCLGDGTAHSGMMSNNGDPFKPFALFTNSAPAQLGLVYASTSTPPSGTVPYVASSTGVVLDSTGSFFTKYNGQTLAGNGLPGMLYSSGSIGAVAAITDTSMLTVGGTSTPYRFTGGLNCTATSASATASLNLKWTDTENVAQTLSVSVNCTGTTIAAVGDMVHLIRAKNATAITWGVTIVNTPTYDVDVRLESL